MSIKLDLINILYDQNTWVSSDSLGEKLKLSNRTIRKYIQDLNKIDHVIDSSKKGYRIKRDQFSKCKNRISSELYEFISPQERISIIIQKLVAAKLHGVDIYEVSEELGVSDSTIKQDVKKIKTLVEPYCLEIHLKNDICYLQGLEKDKRKLIKETLYEEAGNSIQEIFLNQDFLVDQDIGMVREILSDVLGEEHMDMNEYAYSNLLIHLIIAISRLKESNVMKFGDHLQEDISKMKNEKEFQIAEQIFSKTKQVFRIEYTNIEIYYLALQLLGNLSNVNHKRNKRELISTHYIEMTEKIISDINSNYLVDLYSEDFILKFALHLENMISRLKNQCNVYNPMVKELKMCYPVIYDLSIYVADLIEKQEKTHVTESEIGYIAIHLGAFIENQKHLENKVKVELLCPKYHDMHKIISDKISKQFAEDIVIVKTITEISSYVHANEVDLVISTVDLLLEENCKYVKIMPFLGVSDIHEIEKCIYDIRKEKELSCQKNYIVQYIKKDLFYKNINADSKEELIELLCQRMEHFELIGDNFKDSVLQREKISSTAFQNVAVPHSIYMDAISSGICIVVYDNGFSWDEHKVDIVALIAINDEDREVFGDLFEMLIRVLSEEKNTRELKKTASYDEFIEKLQMIIAEDFY